MSDCPKAPQFTSGKVNSLFLTCRSITLSLCPVAECSLWLEAATTHWITKKSFLCLGLSTAGTVTKLIFLHFFFSFFLSFAPVKQKEPQQGNRCAGLCFSIEEIDNCRTLLHWSKSGRNMKWHFPSCLHAAFRGNQCRPRAWYWNHCHLPAGAVCPSHHRPEKERRLGIGTFGHWSLRCLGTSSCCKF